MFVHLIFVAKTLPSSIKWWHSEHI